VLPVTGAGGSEISGDAGSAPAQVGSGGSATASFGDPGPALTGALTLGRSPAFPVLGLLVLAVLAAAAPTLRRLQQER
jgi:hypothetical protein